MARLAFLALVLSACVDDSPVFVGGDYTVAVTAGANGCAIPNWTPGSTASNIQLQLVQSQGSPSVTGTIQGATGVVFQILLGTNSFSGRVSGRDLEALLTGANTLTQGQCQYKVQVDLKGQLAGDVLTGSVDFTTSTNHSPECGTLEGCHSIESFNGTRPPSH